MSAENKNEELLGPETKSPEVQDTSVIDGANVPEVEMAWSNADGGSISSIAPSVEKVVDTEGINIVEKKSSDKDEEKEEEKYAFPQLFVQREKLIEIQIEVVFDPYGGDIYSIAQPGMLNTAVLETLRVVNYTFKFRPVNYDDMHKYRKQASAYDSKAGELVINRLQLRTFFLVNHLRETDLVKANGEPFVVEIDPENDNMSLKSLTEIFQTVPALLDVVMTLFERKLLILFQVSQ